MGHDRSSSLHLAEHHSDWPGKRTFEQASAMVVDGKRTWVRFQELFSASDDFTAIGAGVDATTECQAGIVGSATVKLMSQTELVDFGAKWIRENRR